MSKTGQHQATERRGPRRSSQFVGVLGALTLLGLLAVAFRPGSAQALDCPVDATTTWTGNVDGDWNNDGNWDAGVPTEEVHACIPSGAAVTTSSDAVARSLTADGDLTIVSGDTLRLLGASEIAGNVDWSGEIVAPEGLTLVDGGDGAVTTVTSTAQLAGGLVNERDLVQNGSLRLVSDVATTVTNNGTWTLDNDAVISEIGDDTIIPIFDNAATGTLRKASGTGTSTIGSTNSFLRLDVSSSGLIDVDAGSVVIYNVTSLTALAAADTFDVVDGAQLRLDGDTATPGDLAGTFTSTGTGTITLSGSWTTTAPTVVGFAPGVATLSLDTGTSTGLDATAFSLTNIGDLTWDSGRITGSFTNNGTVTLGAGSTSVAGVFVNDGVVTQTGTVSLVSDVATTVTNNGTWTLDNDAVISETGSDTIIPIFDNAATGTLRKVSGTGTSTIGSTISFLRLDVSSSGLIDVDAGSVVIYNVTSLTALAAADTFEIVDGAQLRLDGDTATPGDLAGTFTSTGTGTITLSGSWTTTAPTVVGFAPGVATLSLDTGTSTGLDATAFSLTNIGDLTWTSGRITGAFVNDGTVDQTGTVSLASDVATTVTNNGTWTLDNNADISETGNDTITPTFSNTTTGTLRKASGTSSSFVSSSVDVSSSGLIDVDTGTLAINNVTSLTALAATDTFDVADGAQLRLDADTATPGDLAGTFTNTGTGTITLQGSWTATDDITFDLAPDTATLTLDPAGLDATGFNITNTGDLTWTSGRITGSFTNTATGALDAGSTSLAGAFVNDGIVDQTGTVSLVSDVATTVTNNGTWTLDNSADISETGNDTITPTFSNATTGTLRKASGTSSSFVSSSVDVSSSGLIDVDTGTLAINNVTSLTALAATDTFDVADGAQLRLDADTATPGDLAGTFTNTGTGTITLQGSWTATDDITFDLAPDTATLTLDPAGLDATGFNITNTGDLTWTSGRITGSFTNTATGALDAGSTSLAGAFVNDGIVDQTGTVSLVSDVATTVTNNGTWTLDNSADISETGNDTITPTFSNATTGTLRKASGTSSSFVSSSVDVSSSGLIDVDTGTLAINNVTSLTALAATDTFDVADGAQLRLDADTATPGDLAGTFTNTGTGTITLQGSWTATDDITFDLAPDTATLTLDPAGLDATGFNITNTGDLTWTSGRITGSFTNTATGALDAGSTSLAGAFVNDGIVDQTGTVSLVSDVATTVTNNGTWTLDNSADISETGNDTITPTFDNTTTGTLRKTGTSTATVGPNLAVSSIGTVETLGGTLSVPVAVPQLSAGVLSSGTWRAVDSTGLVASTLRIGETATTITEIGVDANVELGGEGASFPELSGLTANRGSFTVTDGATYTTAGDLTNDGELVIGPDAVITVTGDYEDTSANSLHIKIADESSTGSFGQLFVDGNGNFAAGALDIDLVGEFTPITDDFYDVIFYDTRSPETFAQENLTEFFDALYDVDDSDGLGSRVRLNESLNARPTLINVPTESVGVDEGTRLTVPIGATDDDNLPTPTQTLTFSLEGTPPEGAVIDPGTGEFTWTPTEAQGPETYDVTVRVTDDGDPPLFDEAEFRVVVDEVNTPPTVAPIDPQVVDELALLEVDVASRTVDDDLPQQTLRYTLVSPPEGASIGAFDGVFRWTPNESQGPDVVTITVRVTDNGPEPTPVDVSFDVTVNDVNDPPVLDQIASEDFAIDELDELTFVATATDPDLPAQELTFSLVGAPSGASIDPVTGQFRWRPTEIQGPNTYRFDVVVTDDGPNALDDREQITVNVAEVNVPPVAVAGPDATTIVGQTVTLDGSGSFDDDRPAQDLTFSWSLTTVPAGSALTDLDAGATPETPTLTPDVEGDYVVELVVNDGSLDSTPATVTISAGVDVRTLAVTLEGEGFGSVASTAGEIDCGATCSNEFEVGSRVRLDAVADPGSVFRGWSGDCSGIEVCAVTMDQDRAVTATFAENRRPLARDDQAVLHGDTVLRIDVLDNDIDVDGDDLTVVTSDALGGRANCSGSSCTYERPPGFTGEEAFRYTVDDGNGGRSTATVFVTVRANLDPIARPDRMIVLGNRSGIVSVLANDVDPDGDDLRLDAELVVDAEFGAVSCSGMRCTYLSDTGAEGVDSFTYRVRDDRGGEATARVDVSIKAYPNGDPTAVDDEVLSHGTKAVNFNPLTNDVDPEDDQLELLDVAGITVDVGGIECTARGACVYTPPESGPFPVETSFDYTIQDDFGSATSTATVQIRISENQPPRASDDLLTAPGWDEPATNPPWGRIRPFDGNKDTDPDGDTPLLRRTLRRGSR